MFKAARRMGEGQPAESLSSKRQHISLKGQAMQTLIQHVLSTYCVPGTVLGAGDTSVTNTQSLSLRSSQSIGGETHKHVTKDLSC